MGTGESPGGSVEESLCGKICDGDDTLWWGGYGDLTTILSAWTELAD